MELEPADAARGLVHVEADDAADPLDLVEKRQEALGEHSGDAGHRDRPREHVHRLIG
jgi:hypothetical protein